VATNFGSSVLREVGDYVEGGIQGAILSCRHPELFRKVVTESPARLLRGILHDPVFDLVEHVPGIGGVFEAARDAYDVYVSGTQELPSVVDKWRNCLLITAICGKGGKKIAAGILEAAGDVQKVEKKIVKTGKQARLKKIMNDDKVSSAWKGWLKQDYNAMVKNRTARPGLRVPPGTQLSHERGFEAAKGYGYEHARLQFGSNHKAQHKVDNMGRFNKDRGKK
jgi:hypothetical protein